MFTAISHVAPPRSSLKHLLSYVLPNVKERGKELRFQYTKESQTTCKQTEGLLFRPIWEESANTKNASMF